jgi:hypothetical protein
MNECFLWLSNTVQVTKYAIQLFNDWNDSFSECKYLVCAQGIEVYLTTSNTTECSLSHM